MNESEYSKITLSKDSTVEVYYTPKKTTVKGQTKFYDYTIMAGRGDGTYWNQTEVHIILSICRRILLIMELVQIVPA